MKTEVEVREGLRHLPIRPVYLASVGHEGKKNIISIGMFGYFSGKPTIVGIGIAPKRHSYELIRKSGEFVVNIVDEKLMDAVKICGEQSGRDIDKFQVAKLTAEKGSRVKAPLIGESPVSIECKVVNEVEVGDHVWFMGEVLATKVREGYDWKEGLLFKWIGEDGVYYRVGKKIADY